MLLELPEEILLIIVKKLDVHSKISLYNVCPYLRNIITHAGNIKKFDVSRSTLATAETLKQSFFRHVCGQIEDLSLRTVPNITKCVLMPTIRRLVNLKYLNVSFTSVVIPDLISISIFATHLKGVSVNFEFGKVDPCRLSPEMLNECQNVFEKLTEVEFVGSPSNLLFSELPYHVLKKTNLDSLKFLITQCEHATYQSASIDPDLKFKHLALSVTNWKEEYKYCATISEITFVKTALHSKNYEFVLIERKTFRECKVYTSTAFKGMFYQKFNIEEQCSSKIFKQVISGNTAIFLWHKECNTFDSNFFVKFFERIKCYFPQFIIGTAALELSPSEPNWFYLTVSTPPGCNKNQIEKYSETIKRKRVGAQSYTLDYDNCFSQMKEIEVTVNLESVSQPVSISSSLNYLKKITYLSLAGRFVLYTVDFFSVLFKSCDKLCTLNVEASGANTCSRYLTKYIVLSKSLRNLRLVDNRLDHKSLFHSLSQCVQLENVHIVDEGLESVNIGDISCIIAECPNMYSLFVQVAMSNSSRLKVLSLLNKAKSLHNRSFLNIELHSSHITSFLSIEFHTRCTYKGLAFDPFIEVFKINPIKPI